MKVINSGWFKRVEPVFEYQNVLVSDLRLLIQKLERGERREERGEGERGERERGEREEREIGERERGERREEHATS